LAAIIRTKAHLDVERGGPFLFGGFVNRRTFIDGILGLIGVVVAQKITPATEKAIKLHELAQKVEPVDLFATGQVMYVSGSSLYPMKLQNGQLMRVWDAESIAERRVNIYRGLEGYRRYEDNIRWL
jgi:hypothetical protein